jgi:8-oxo-dGTP diphosphatase
MHGFSQNIFVAVDTVVIANNQKVLLIKRKNPPFQGKWALPGGFVEQDEDLPESAMRELEEETGVRAVINDLSFVGVYGAPNRDPRFRTVSIVYRLEIPETVEVKGGDDAAEAAWFDLDDLPELAFDHAEVIKDAQF